MNGELVRGRNCEVEAAASTTAYRELVDRLRLRIREAHARAALAVNAELAEDARERQLEQALMDDIQRFLLELGSGFAFYGRQRSLLVGAQEFFPDLLFYHHALRRFVVIELKMGPFEVEYVSKMNLYLGAIDEQLRRGDDRESVGIILRSRSCS